jgi:hypothetical protein
MDFKLFMKNRKVQIIYISDEDEMTSNEFGKFVVSMYDFTFLQNFFDD